ncbi:CBS domain-containing protein [Streptomyces sp. NPDC046685]|uniref:CBS domain-containing protein n=1 Tax=Streptomyces sp. NPDC046685 TaxID=3157202 RepID=UPI0033F91A2D
MPHEAHRGGRPDDRRVVSVVTSTSFKDVAKLLAQHDISGLPVLDEEDRVLGVISESDLRTTRTSRRAEYDSAVAVSLRGGGLTAVEAVFGVIYPPQVALVGLGRVIEQPVAVNGMRTVHPTVDRLLQRPEDV